MLTKAVQAATRDGRLITEDGGLVAAAMVAARALDDADAVRGLKGGYLVAQLMTPYREALHALRLPAEVEPADEPRPPAAGGDGQGAPSWLSDEFGTPGN